MANNFHNNSNTMKNLFLAIIFIASTTVSAQKRADVGIPDILGFKTLKCDFHMHTVFSDGKVWPTTRVEEAWREGLDAIAITDHLEYRPYSKDVVGDHNRSYEIAKPMADNLGIILIRGSEITRAMPPGHSNAIFLKDCNALDTETYMEAFKEAKKQGAFIFWNHPSWWRQQPDTTMWFKEHTELQRNGMMHGIEVVNGGDYSEIAHQWCIEKNLTLIAASDVHNPIGMDVDFSTGQHRAMTLVFAKEKTPDAVYEALMNRRTAIYFQNKIIGHETYLKAIADASLKVEKVERNGKRISVTLYNDSNVPFTIAKVHGNDHNLEFFRNMEIKPYTYATFPINEKEESKADQFALKVQITNLIVAPQKYLPYTLNIVPTVKLSQQ
jgi:3',5'-nucleoside bisphosphate phosphatase